MRFSLLFLSILFQACSSGLDNSPSENEPPVIDDGSKIEFTEEELKLPGKKGICYTLRETDYAVNMQRVIALKPKWNYSWGFTRAINQPENIEFVPMTWGGFDSTTLIPRINIQINSGYTKRILGFNEPDGKDQANMSVKRAIDLWPALMSLKIPLGSPAVVSAAVGDSKKWLDEFMDEVEKRGYRVDYICVHDYGGGSASYFKRMLTELHEKYNRPLLITEFAVADWSASTPGENKFTEAHVLKFMKDVLPWMEETDFIYGYCWYPFPITSAAGCKSALFDENNQLTELGKFYRDFPDNVAP